LKWSVNKIGGGNPILDYFFLQLLILKRGDTPKKLFNLMNFINAKLKSKCAETCATIAKGENCLYDRVTKKVLQQVLKEISGRTGNRKHQLIY